MPIYNSIIACVLFVFSSAVWANYTLPKYEKLTLDNGLTVYLMPQSEVPLIDVSVVVKVGAIDDGDVAGLSYMTARNLTLGTEKLTKSALDESVDFIGADISSFANFEFTTISSSFAKKDTSQMLAILHDVVTSPRFDQKEFDKLKQRHSLNLTQQKESPRSVINTYFNGVIFGKQGYGSVIRGDQASISGLSLAQIKTHHEKWYQANNAAIIVVGDFKVAKMKKRISTLFGHWANASKSLTQAKVEVVSAASQSNVLLVNKADARESTFLIGGKGIKRSNEDRVGLSVINTILGARFTSWLNDELRVNAGLTYGARSRFSSYSKDGSFAISTFTKTATTIEAIDLALKTYARLWEKGIDENTLKSAKAYVNGQFPPRFETSTELAALLVNMYGYQFNESYINTFEQQVDSLTVDKTKQLISKYFPKKNLQFVVVGQADEIRTDLAKYGQVTEINIQDVGFSATK